jgi:hypothetical protein
MTDQTRSSLLRHQLAWHRTAQLRDRPNLRLHTYQQARREAS